VACIHVHTHYLCSVVFLPSQHSGDGARNTLETEQGALCETATSSHFVPYRLEEKTGRNWRGPEGAGHS